MKSSVWAKLSICCLTIVLLAGCQTMPDDESALSVTPVVPGDNEQIVRDQLIILVDVTGSIISARQYEFEKDLVQAFTAAMPDGVYQSGIDSFGGLTVSKWLMMPLEPFNRNRMVGGAESLQPLGSATPLARAIQSQKFEAAGKGGRGGLLVFSDGKVTDPDAVMRACQDLKTVHGGEFCIYTVRIGSSAEGEKLLQDMAAVNGCGKYYDSASLNSPDAIYAMVRDIFFGPKPVTPTPSAPPAPAGPLANILFDNDSAVIAPSYNAELDEVAAVLKNKPAARIQLDGHTDANASNAYNQGLSERRVAAVKDALVQRGVDAARIMTGAHGEEMPAVPNDSPEQRHQNRRVELNLVE